MSRSIAFIIPARNEAATVVGVIEACKQAGSLLEMPTEVIVVSDGSFDGTDVLALAAGARVIRRTGEPSKAATLSAGVRQTDAMYVFFVDADCLELQASHLIQIAHPVLANKSRMSVGTFDYGRVANRIVVRFPWSTGQRIIRRCDFPLDDPRLDGYNVEMLINEKIGASGDVTTSQVMDGVHQRTKRHKLGYLRGARATINMYERLVRWLPSMSKSQYKSYMQNVMVSSGTAFRAQPRSLVITGYLAIRALSFLTVATRQ